jgi:hypothetical protein
MVRLVDLHRRKAEPFHNERKNDPRYVPSCVAAYEKQGKGCRARIYTSTIYPNAAVSPRRTPKSLFPFGTVSRLNRCRCPGCKILYHHVCFICACSIRFQRKILTYRRCGFQFGIARKRSATGTGAEQLARPAPKPNECLQNRQHFDQQSVRL